ncbi:MAG: hypothetical protein QG580_148 [Patescibacteria group bacterium]|jgi:disulfide bond formation protein DsbB|nr:hypothetical protein [Patescibacteria group bacterium]
MTPLANTTNIILGAGTLILQAISLFLIVSIITKDKGTVLVWFKEKSLLLATVVLLGSAAASLWYSEVIGYLPCLMCWYQRIAIYSAGIIGLIAILKKRGDEAWIYINTLSILGFIIAVFHIFSRFTNSEIFDCAASGPSCLQELFKVYGFIDIPVMSFTALLFVLLLNINRKRLSK